MSYHTPAFADKDYAANAAVIEILCNDPSGIFYKALVDTKIATKITGVCYNMTMVYSGSSGRN